MNVRGKSVTIMKIISQNLVTLFCAFLASSLLAQQSVIRPNVENPVVSPPSEAELPRPIISERGAHHRVWSRVTWETNAVGRSVARTNSYTELETGMHYLEESKWKESKAEIELVPGGAVASRGRHKVSFAANLNSSVAVDFTTPDGRLLRSRVVGLGYYDASAGQAVLIGQVKDSTGELHAPNRVIYPDAFEGIEADVEYIYSKAGFNQNIILREQPPAPEKWDFDPTTTKLQVLTEFIDPPTPEKIAAGSRDFEDETLGFGEMRIGRGKAFKLGDEPQESKSVPVGKRWVKLDSGRTFLVEEVRMQSISAGVQSLPKAKGSAQINTAPAGRGRTLMAALNAILPTVAATERKQDDITTAKHNVSERRGYVLDYQAVIPEVDFTFKGDTTYYCTSNVNLYGTTTIEGGTVVKFSTNANASLVIQGEVVFLTASYRPAIFTAKDDNSVGEVISGSSGSPTGYYGGTTGTLRLSDPGAARIKNVRFWHQYAPLMFDGTDGEYIISNAQFVKSKRCLSTDSSSQVTMQNILAYDIEWLLRGYPLDVIGSHWTVNGCDLLGYWEDGEDPGINSSLRLTNCLLVAVDSIGTVPNIFTNAVVQLSSSVGVFQTVGTGAHYLANNSPYRNVGTTSIDADLLADLGKKTTYPPIVFPIQFITNDLVLYPQAQRDTDLPDLGYHYDPLDFAFGGVSVTNATLTMLPGTALGVFSMGANWGVNLISGAQFVSEGSPITPNWIVRHNMVQEQANLVWSNSVSDMSIVGSGFGADPEVNCSFTKWSVAANQSWHIRDTRDTEFRLSHCEFNGGIWGTSRSSIFLTNCLFNRGFFFAEEEFSALDLTVRNCLFYGGAFWLGHWDSGTWLIRDNHFNGASMQQLDGDVDNDFNGYSPGLTQLYPAGANNVVTNITYVVGPLGNFYQLTNSPFIGEGSTTAGNVGLYHYTVTTNLLNGYQIKEGNSTVDIGYHYVALNSADYPYDSDVDDLADYLEDTNGNGTYSGSTDLSDWNDDDTDNDGLSDYLEVIRGRNPRVDGITSDSNGLIQLRVFTPLK